MFAKRLSAILTAILVLALQVIPFPVIDIAMAEEAPLSESIESYEDIFIISAYYSPLPDQQHYVTGSYESDIYLNGNGTNGADGTPVYPGMIAAPSKYPFGTKMNIPGIGLVAVHDRGGAIVSAGERGYEYDRLDIWMGYGDKGLVRALNWGKRTVQVTVYGFAPELEEQIYLDGYSDAEKFIQNVVYPTLIFPNDIYYGSDGDEVKKMQQYLKDWEYYTEEVSGFYGNHTAQAIFQFQLDYNIVSSPDELGAGHFGINTRRKFDEIISLGESENVIKLQKGRALMSRYPDLDESLETFSRPLARGDSGDDVVRLQEELALAGFLRLKPTGFFGEITEHAVFKFQQYHGLVETKDDRGAGYVGPATRRALNAIISNRIDMKSFLAYRREELENYVAEGEDNF